MVRGRPAEMGGAGRGCLAGFIGARGGSGTFLAWLDGFCLLGRALMRYGAAAIESRRGGAVDALAGHRAAGNFGSF